MSKFNISFFSTIYTNSFYYAANVIGTRESSILTPFIIFSTYQLSFTKHNFLVYIFAVFKTMYVQKQYTDIV